MVTQLLFLLNEWFTYAGVASHLMEAAWAGSTTAQDGGIRSAPIVS
jgi:hypothetical protein